MGAWKVMRKRAVTMRKERRSPGLYVAGNVQGNRFSVDYPLTVPGLSHSIALTFGRIAGRNAAQG